MISVGSPPGSYRLGALFEPCCLSASSHPPQQAGVVLQRISDVWVIRVKHFLSNRQRPLVERFGLLVLPLRVVDVCQVIEGDADVWMIKTEHFLKDRQRALVKWFGLLVLPLRVVDVCQITKRPGGFTAIKRAPFLFYRHPTLEEGFGVLVLPLGG